MGKFSIVPVVGLIGTASALLRSCGAERPEILDMGRQSEIRQRLGMPSFQLRIIVRRGESEPMPQEIVKRFGENVPLGRAGQSAELAGAYVLLASAEASSITGAIIPVTGGRPML